VSLLSNTLTTNGLSRFFPPDRHYFVREEDIDQLITPLFRALFLGMHENGLVNRPEGCLRAIDSRTNYPVAAHDLGDRKTWRYPYDQIVDGKDWLAADSSTDGFNTRVVQRVSTLRLRGGHVAYFGVYERDGLRVLFSGVQSFQDEKLAMIFWALLAGLYDLRVKCLQDVMAALRLDYYWQAMNEIEKVAEEFGFTSLEETVQRILDNDTMRRAAEIAARRKEDPTVAGG
jgi:hypothetical protein